MRERRRAARAPDADDKGDHTVVTPCKVTTEYKFPSSELSAMPDKMGKQINEIDSLDVYWLGLMNELHQLWDITLFYNQLIDNDKAINITHMIKVFPNYATGSPTSQVQNELEKQQKKFL